MMKSSALPPICVGTQLSKSYAGKLVLDELSFTIFPGEVLGMLGPNGAGKSTTVGIIYGLIAPDSGTLHVGECNIAHDGRKARELIGVVSQENNLDPNFSVEENLRYFALHYQLRGKASAERVDEVLHLVRLEEFRKQKIAALSGGLQRRLVLARALLGRPKLLLLDEPTTGLDPDARQDFWRVVSELRELGAGILLTTHYMDEAERLCDRLLLLRGGTMIDEGTPTELIARTVGKDVLEFECAELESIESIAIEHDAWFRRFGRGYVVGTKGDSLSRLSEYISSLNPQRLTRRRSDLQDVFLFLTGDQLD